ncbi:MAG TPA: type II toxin-antitoxin system Phd/YefM family antitoxin [Verrucomicrobiae bacterium]|jgi:prevent-host-death family protein|nr:type II toxin-antitoxin system Phd/YefM family antitoxin [Verrucomicrobiae bacterium]
MKVVNVHAAKTNFSKLLALVEASGSPVVISRRGVPVAEIVRYKKKDRTIPNPALKAEIHEDPTEPLSEEAWPEEFR